MLSRFTTLLMLFLTLPTLTEAGPPTTPKKPITDVYHGVKVVDDYRHLEDASSKKVQAWTKAQNAHARSILDKLPDVKRLRAQLKKILSAKRTSHASVVQRGGKFFALRFQPPREQPFLVVMPSLKEVDKARTLVDPIKLDARGTTAIDWFVPSPDGKLVAVSLSKGGSESGDVHVFDVGTGMQVHEVVPRVNGGTAGGDLAWTADGKGFFYTRYPRGKERPPEDRNFYQQVYFHQLGRPTAKDRYEMGKGLPRIAEITLEMEHTTGRLLATVQDGDSGRFAHYLRTITEKWKQFTAFRDGIVQATFGPGDGLFLVSRHRAPRGKVLRISARTLAVAQAELIVPEGKDTIVTDFYDEEGIVPTKRNLYVVYQLGGPTELRVFTLTGKELPTPKQLPVSTVSSVTHLEGDTVLYANGSFVQSTHWYLYTPGERGPVKAGLSSPLPVSFDDIRVVREFATSKDGTRVPINILIPKGVKRDGNNPCLVTGYGGYGISIVPRLRPSYRVLFDRGFVVAITNLRGGGEYGEAWHRAGNLTRKQNVFDDFTAALQHMIRRRYTSSKKLAILGGSNGGLLMGAILTQHPGLVRAVVSYVGIYDMLRVELSPNGAFNIPEFGTVKNPKHFRALYAYSPYHNVKDGVKYPATLFITGANDPRVDPMQSRKMTARMQSAQEGQAPILLRTDASTGHGRGTSLSRRIEELVDVYAFVFAQLEVSGTTPTSESKGKR